MIIRSRTIARRVSEEEYQLMVDYVFNMSMMEIDDDIVLVLQDGFRTLLCYKLEFKIYDSL